MQYQYIQVRKPISDTKGILVKIEGISTALAGSDVLVSWTLLSDYNITAYEVERKTGAGSWSVVQTTAQNSWTDPDVSEGNTYTYRVRGKNASDEYTDYSAESVIEVQASGDPDFIAHKTRVEADGGTIPDETFTGDIIAYYKSISKYDANLHFIHKSCGVKLDVNGKVEKLYDVGSNFFDMTAPTEANRATLDADAKWMTFTGSTFYTMQANYPYATDGMNLNVVAQSGGGSNTAFIIDFGQYSAAGYGLVVGQNDLRSYLPNKNQLYGHGGAYNTEKTIVEIRLLLNDATGFKTFKDNVEIVSLTTSSTTVLNETNISESPTRDAEAGPFTFGASSKTSQAGRTYQGISGGFQFYGAILSDVEAEGLNSILSAFYGVTI